MTVDKSCIWSFRALPDGSAELSGYEGREEIIVVPSEAAGMRVSSIGPGVFSRHAELMQVYIGDGIQEIGPSAFYWCENIEKLRLPEGLRKIGREAFAGCESIGLIELPETLEEINGKAFFQCRSLTINSFPEPLFRIGQRAFDGCASLESVSLPPNVDEMGDYAFARCIGLKEVSLNNARIIGRGCFAACIRLSDINTGERLEKIGPQCFSACTSLRCVKLPQHISEIGGGVFLESRNIKEISFHAGVKKIGASAFCTDYRDKGRLSSIIIHMEDGAARLIIPAPDEDGLRLRYMRSLESFGVSGLGAYDGLFRHMHHGPEKISIALSRLKYPAGLSPSARSEYEEYISGRAALESLIARGLDAELLFAAENGYIPNLLTDSLISLSIKAKRPEITAVLFGLSGMAGGCREISGSTGIVTLARRRLASKADGGLRNAILRLKPAEASSVGSTATDGYIFYYNENYIKKIFAHGGLTAVMHEYLHSVIHCVMLLPFRRRAGNPQVYDAAADVCTELIIRGLGLAGRQTPLSVAASSAAREAGGGSIPILSRYIRENPEKAAPLCSVFHNDDHSMWKEPIKAIPRAKFRTEGIGGLSKASALAESGWKSLSLELLPDMQNLFSADEAAEGGGLIQAVTAIRRDRINYSRFLRGFAEIGESMELNHDENDMILYTYGLSLYKNLPLVEPLETREVRRIRELIIAIDTSGSVSGSLVQAFLEKTYSILNQDGSFFSRMRLRIIQCDSMIQDEAEINSAKDFSAYLRTMTIHGLGGTDFRPVFERAQELMEEGRFIRLSGIIYFSDGMGAFPEAEPKFKTAFISIGDGEPPSLPSWVDSLRITERGIERINSGLKEITP